MRSTLGLAAMLCSALACSGSVAQVRPAPPNMAKMPKVTKVEVMFHTNDDDLDPDTKLQVDFECGGSVWAASSQTVSSLWFDNDTISINPAWFFRDNTDSPWQDIVVQTASRALPTESSVHNCTTTIRIDPVGHDTWRFNYFVRLHYSDGKMDEYHYNGHALSEKVRENSFPLR